MCLCWKAQRQVAPAMGDDLSAAEFVSQLQALTGGARQDATIAIKPATDQEVAREEWRDSCLPALARFV